MSQRMFRTVASVVAGSLAVLTMAACSSPEPENADAVRAKASILSDGDFPAGYTVRQIGAEQHELMRDQFADSSRGARVTPEACKSTDPAPDEARTASVVAVNGKSTISSSVAPTGLDARALRAAVAGECATVRVEVTAGPAQGTVIDIENADVVTPRIADADALIVRQIARPEDGGSTREILIGRVVVSGFLVTVQSVHADGKAPDRGDFDQTLERAVRKAAAQAGEAG